MLRLQGAAVDAINPSVELTEADRLDRLRLIRSDNVGPRGVTAPNATSVSS
jgi:DNA processing protein